MARPHPAVASVHTARPRAISRKAFTCLLASAKMGDDTKSPTCTEGKSGETPSGRQEEGGGKLHIPGRLQVGSHPA